MNENNDLIEENHPHNSTDPKDSNHTEEEEVRENNHSNVINSTDIRTNQRKSQKVSKPPALLNDYYCNMTKHWCGLVEHKEIKINNVLYKKFEHHEPRNFKEAISNPLWKDAMDKEINALERN